MQAPSEPYRLSPGRLVATVCVAQVLVQIGAFFWPTLLPGMLERWSLSNSAAGWITAAFYAGYLVAAPILITLTDRVDPKRIYLIGVGCTVLGHGLFGLVAEGFWSAAACRALAGIGWAGTYMTGIKLLADHVGPKLMARAVTGHAASIGLSGALSFSCADILSDLVGWRLTFIAAAASAAIAWVMIALFAPPRPASATYRTATDGRALYDFRPVLANRSAMAYAIAYGVHTLEMTALRGWGVAFLGYVATRTGTDTPLLSPTATLTAFGLAGTLASVFGNEASAFLGRRRLITVAMLASAVAGGVIGFVGGLSYTLAAALVFVWGVSIYLDSSALTAGAAGTAEPSRRGATLALHSMLGYAGGFIGPLMVGVLLDASGGMSPSGWGTAFSAVAVLSVVALSVFWIIRPRELESDRNGI